MKIIIAVLAADMLTGIIHWWEDAYGNPNWKYIGESVVLPNLEHHKKPRAFLNSNWWNRVNTSLMVAAVLIGLCYVFGIFNYYTVFAVLLASQGNEIHRFSHQTKKENGRLITLLQLCSILQTRRHHAKHHTAPYECNYCVITNYVNPMLEAVHFWTKAEQAIKKLTGIDVLRGSVVRNYL
jgi:ubiquitin-conjugating enzyme E2 variant